jgi:sigma-B regulation protein RsbU (phosphoserine phosphatase)
MPVGVLTTTEPSVEEITRILARLPIFEKLDLAARVAVAQQCSVATFAAGDAIMHQGERENSACLILSGEVDVFVEIAAGQVHVATVGGHRIVGELAAFTDMPRTATVLARGAVGVLRIERDVLMRLAAEFPAIGIAIIGELGSRLQSMNLPLAYLTYAATALARDEYDPALLAELPGQPRQLADFTRAFADMAAEIRAKQHRRQEMLAAAEIQQSILPRPLACIGAARAVDLHAEMRPAREIGGDFYDYFLIDERHLALTVADVSGKGIPAALFMAVSRTVLRSIGTHGELAPRMQEVNRLLAADNSTCMFVTMFYAVLDLATGELRYCNAGHNPPYLLRAAGGREILTSTGVPFGIDPGQPYRIATTALRPGDALFVFSDGITEAFNANGVEFGTTGLEAALEAARGSSAAELVARILQATTAFIAGAEQSDDITALAAVWRGA